MSLSDLETAWSRRNIIGPTRIFHGPGDGSGELQNLSIDAFGERYWLTQKGPIAAGTFQIIEKFLKIKGATTAVLQERAKDEVMNPCRLFFGEDIETFETAEYGLKYLIRFSNVRHPGLFLDHANLRHWLQQNAKFATVLNTFCYTGSLSVAAHAGGSAHVTHLDLSKPAIEWSRENWRLNGFKDKDGDFIYGDVFEWLPRFEKKGRKFDCVIVDPPSSSHGPKGHFSTKKNLAELLVLGARLLTENGYLICSINSQNISWDQFEEFIEAAAGAVGCKFKKVRKLELPDSFPTDPAEPDQKYLKGFILQLL